MKQIDYSRIRTMEQLRLARLHNKVLSSEVRLTLFKDALLLCRSFSITGILDIGNIFLRDGSCFKRICRWGTILLWKLRR